MRLVAAALTLTLAGCMIVTRPPQSPADEVGCRRVTTVIVCVLANCREVARQGAAQPAPGAAPPR